MSIAELAALGKVGVDLITAAGAFIATVTSTISAYFTWKNRYELDQLYAKYYRPKPDGTPGPMRRHPKIMVKLFTRRRR